MEISGMRMSSVSRSVTLLFLSLICSAALGQGPQFSRTFGREIQRGEINVTQAAWWEAAMPSWHGRPFMVHEPLPDPRRAGPVGPVKRRIAPAGGDLEELGIPTAS